MQKFISDTSNRFVVPVLDNLVYSSPGLNIPPINLSLL